MDLSQVLSRAWALLLEDELLHPQAPSALLLAFITSPSVWEGLYMRDCSLEGILFGSHAFRSKQM